MNTKKEKRYRRHKRVRARVKGIGKILRLCVFRSNKHIYAQLIDDETGKTIIAASDKEMKRKTQSAKRKTEKKEEKSLSGKVAVAYEVGKLIAKKATEKKLEKVVFDRGGYKYHGRIKALADGAREGGLKF